MKTLRNPDKIHAPLANYSHQVEVSADEKWLVLSGQVGMTSDGKIPEDPAEQLEIAFQNVRHNLEAADMLPTDIVKINLYLVEEIDPARRKPAFVNLLGDYQPASTLLYVAALAAPPLKVEVDVWASK